MGSRNARVGLGLIGLQAGSHVVAHVDVGDVDRHNVERGLRIEALVEHRLRDQHRVGQHLFVRLARPDRRHNPLAHAGDDCLFGRPANQLIQIGAHGHPGSRPQLNSVFGHPVECRAGPPLGVGAVNHLGVHAGLHGGVDIAAGQVDRRGGVPVEINLGPLRDDQRLHDPLDVPPGQRVGFESLGRNRRQARLHRHHLRFHDVLRAQAPQPHEDERAKPDPRPAGVSLQPRAEEHREQNKADKDRQQEQQRSDDQQN